jgi:CheY-like chemotaxis protein
VKLSTSEPIRTSDRRVTGRLAVLVVDDHPAMCDLLARWLDRLGHASLTALSVGEAIEILEREDVDVVISDLNLPGASGLDLLSYVRHRSGLPFVLTSARLPDGVDLVALASGADAVVAKDELAESLPGLLAAVAA